MFIGILHAVPVYWTGVLTRRHLWMVVVAALSTAIGLATERPWAVMADVVAITVAYGLVLYRLGASRAR